MNQEPNFRVVPTPDQKHPEDINIMHTKEPSRATSYFDASYLDHEKIFTPEERTIKLREITENISKIKAEIYNQGSNFTQEEYKNKNDALHLLLTEKSYLEGELRKGNLH